MAVATILAAAVLLTTVARSTTPWPACVLQDKAPRNPRALFVDVRGFISHPDAVRHRVITYSSHEEVGMVLQEEPHELGEVVKDTLPESQAKAAGVQHGWIITEINGKPFKKTERLADIAKDFGSAKKDGSTLTVKYDVRTFIDCTDGDCRKSDRFPSQSALQCATACSQSEGCTWWAFEDQDADSICQIMQGVAGFIRSSGNSVGDRECAPAPLFNSTGSWPRCIVNNVDMVGNKPVFGDVRSYIDHADSIRHREVLFGSEGNVGMVLSETPHDLGELVSSVLPDSQAEKSGVRGGWIIKLLDGAPFKANEKLIDVGADFATAKSKATMFTVLFDVRTSIDCTDANCSRSDKFPTDSNEVCANACAQVAGCGFWSVSREQGDDKMCRLRSDSTIKRHSEGATAGPVDCHPPKGARYMLYSISVVVVLFALARFVDLPFIRWIALPLNRFRNSMKVRPPKINHADSEDELDSLMELDRNANKRGGSYNTWSIKGSNV